MRAQILEAFNQPYTFNGSYPEPPAPLGHDILVRVKAASFCHTDAVFASGQMSQNLPRIGSHEFAGIVEQAGPDAEGVLQAKGIQKGDLVGVPGRAYHPCGECSECINNDGDSPAYGIWCTLAGNNGLTRDGGFQDYSLVDSRQIARVGSDSGLGAVDVAPLMCAGVTVWNALKIAGSDMTNREKNKDKFVAILGAGGGLGHLGVQFAAKLGWTVLAIDMPAAMGILEDTISKLGDDGKNVILVDVTKESANDAKKRIFGQAPSGRGGEKGTDASLILPEAQAAFDFGMNILKNHGTTVAVSFPKAGWHFKPGDLVFRHIRLLGALTGRVHQLQAMIDFSAANNVRAKIRTYPLERLNGLVDDYNKGVGGKLVVDMDLKE